LYKFYVLLVLLKVIKFMWVLFCNKCHFYLQEFPFTSLACEAIFTRGSSLKLLSNSIEEFLREISMAIAPTSEGPITLLLLWKY